MRQNNKFHYKPSDNAENQKTKTKIKEIFHKPTLHYFTHKYNNITLGVDGKPSTFKTFFKSQHITHTHEKNARAREWRSKIYQNVNYFKQ